jgi:hypothetical protein
MSITDGKILMAGVTTIKNPLLRHSVKAFIYKGDAADKQIAN